MKEISEHTWAQIALLFIQSLTLDSNRLNPVSEDTADILLKAAPPSLLADMEQRGINIMVDIAAHKLEEELDG